MKLTESSVRSSQSLESRPADAAAQRFASGPQHALLSTRPRGLRLGYLLRMYPRFSQTFVVNEILELERQEADLHILSLRKPTDGRFQESICRVRAGVDYVPELFAEEERSKQPSAFSILRALIQEFQGLADAHLVLGIGADQVDAGNFLVGEFHSATITQVASRCVEDVEDADIDRSGPESLTRRG